MRSIIAALLLGFALVSGAAAQCPFTTITLQHVGNGCNVGPTGLCRIVARPTVLSATLDSQTCTTEFAVTALDGVCGVDVAARVLVLSDRTLQTPLPQFGQHCVLWVQPDIVLATLADAPFSIRIPPNIQPPIFYAQAAAVHLVQIPQETAFTLTDAFFVSIL